MNLKTSLPLRLAFCFKHYSFWNIILDVHDVMKMVVPKPSRAKLLHVNFEFFEFPEFSRLFFQWPKTESQFGLAQWTRAEISPDWTHGESSVFPLAPALPFLVLSADSAGLAVFKVFWTAADFWNHSSLLWADSKSLNRDPNHWL